MEKGNQLAQILIVENDKKEEAELAVKFNFGKTEMLKEYLILIDKLYDYKI